MNSMVTLGAVKLPVSELETLPHLVRLETRNARPKAEIDVVIKIERKAQERFFLRAFAGNAEIGFMSMLPKGNFQEIVRCDNYTRGKTAGKKNPMTCIVEGLGTQLVEYGMALNLCLGTKDMFVSSTEEALPFYQKMGFQVSDTSDEAKDWITRIQDEMARNPNYRHPMVPPKENEIVKTINMERPVKELEALRNQLEDKIARCTTFLLNPGSNVAKADKMDGEQSSLPKLSPVIENVKPPEEAIREINENPEKPVSLDLCVLIALAKSHGKTITSLNLSRKTISNAQINELIGYCPNLLHLNLEAVSGIHDHDEILQEIAKLNSLQTLNLAYWIQITDAGLEKIGGLLSLKELILLSCVNVTDKGLLILGKLSKLRILCLNNCNKITDTGLVVLKEFLALEELDLSGCPLITVAGLKSISGLSLRKLKLKFCNSIDDKAIAFLAFIRSLEALELAYCEKLTDAIFKYLMLPPNLKLLNVNGCRLITAEGIKQSGLQCTISNF